MLLLLIETATEICSVALAQDENIIDVKECCDGLSHSRNLIPFINELLKKANIGKKELSGIGLSIGPGSYTGLRIGTSTAKGLAYSLDIPIVTSPTLLAVMMGAQQDFPDDDYLFCPMIDARRMEVYTALYDHNGNTMKDVHALVVEKDSFEELLAQHTVVFCGNGMPKCQELLSQYDRAFFSDRPLSAANLLKPTIQKFKAKAFEDVAYFEPFYLKEFVAAKSKVKGLGEIGN